jgi:pseudaminic acid synthase
MGGPDAAFSMEPEEFKSMVIGVREAERSLGEITYKVEDKNKLRRRSIFVSQDIEEGQIFTEENIKIIRPGHGMHPMYFEELIGKRAKRAYKKGDPLFI